MAESDSDIQSCLRKDYTQHWISSLPFPEDVVSLSDIELKDNCCQQITDNEIHLLYKELDNISMNGQSIESQSVCNESECHLNEDFSGIPVKDVEKFRQLMAKFGDKGIPAISFANEYEKQFKVRINCYRFPSLVEMFFRVKNVFAIEEVEAIDKWGLIGRHYIIHDSRYKKSSFLEKIALSPEVIDVKCDKLLDIPIKLQINIFNRLRNVKNGLLFKDINGFLFQQFGDSSYFHFFNRLSKLIPIQIIDNQTVISKSSQDIKLWIEKLASNQCFHYFPHLVNIPEDCILPGFKYSKLSQEDILNDWKNKITSVLITNYLKPKLFFGSIIDPEFEELYKEMQSFYNNNINGLNYSFVPKDILIPGLVCVAKWGEKCWLRVQVIEWVDSNKLRVRSVDNGFKMRVNYEDLRLMKIRFSCFPKQALKLRLNGIKSNVEKDIWSKRVKKYITKYHLQSPHFEKLFCEFVRIKYERIEVILYETHDLVNYYSINEMLVIQKVAQKKLKSYKEPNWKLLYTIVNNSRIQSILSQDLKYL